VKTDGEMDNEYSRDTGSIGHKTKTNKTKKHNKDNTKDEQHAPHKYVFEKSKMSNTLPTNTCSRRVR
jgi:hypothetical protein